MQVCGKFIAVLTNEDVKSIENIPLFFIIGRARSGTTLIRTLFDAHPNVNIPTESPFILKLMPRYYKVTNWTTEQLQSFYDDLIQISDFNTWTIDNEKLKSDILSCKGKFTYSFLCKVVIWNYNSVFDKETIFLLGDKNPVYSIALPEIFSLFPESKYIYVCRDYRDHIVSMLKTGLYSSDVYRLAYRWKHSLALLNRLKKKYPQSFYVYRYEDFVNDPENYIRQMCNFLEIPYSSKILAYSGRKDEFMTKLPLTVFNTFFKNLFEPIDASQCGKWQKKLSDVDVRTADSVVGHFAEDWGYQRKYTKTDLKFRLKHLGLGISLWLFYNGKGIRKRLPASIRRLINERAA